MTTDIKTKPTKPLPSFFLFKKENQAKVAELPRVEQAKEMGRLWQELPDEEKNEYRKRSDDAINQYNYDLEQWYLAHPEDKIKDQEELERQRQKNKEKREKGKEKRTDQQPTKSAQKRSKATDANNLLICFTVAQLKKHRTEAENITIYPTNAVKRAVKEAIDKMDHDDQQVWLAFWNGLNEDDKNHIQQFYREWKELKPKN